MERLEKIVNLIKISGINKDLLLKQLSSKDRDQVNKLLLKKEAK